jgi:DNA-directed RNA polymerase alpha subunit
MPSGLDFPRWPIETVAVLIAHLDELPLSFKAINCLNATNAVYFGDVVLLYEAHLLRLPNIDKGIIDELSLLLESFDLRFGMQIPGWSKIRADYIRNIFESKLPNDVAFNRLIKTPPPEDAKTGNATLEAEPPRVDEVAGVVVSAGVAEDTTVNPSEEDFTKWPIETLALLVAHPGELPLSVRATNCVYRTDHKFFGEVILGKEADLYQIPNFGKKSAKEISDLIHEFGLQFEMTIPGWSLEKAIEIRQDIIARLPTNAALTNLISKGAASEIRLVSSAPKDNPTDFTTWPIQQRALLVATPAELPLPPRITNALLNGGYLYLGEVAQLSMYELLKIHNLGRKSAKQLSELLHSNGLEIGIKIPGWSKLNAATCRKELGDQFKTSIRKLNFDSFASNVSAADCLESELQGLIRSIVNGRNAEIGIRLWGFDGSSPKTLEAVGKETRITRERVRQITSGIIRRLEKADFNTPFLDRALDYICTVGPGSNDYLAENLQKSGISKIRFDIDSVISASRIFNRETDLRRVSLGGAVIFLSNPELDGQEIIVLRTLRKHSSSNGCTSVNRIAGEIGLQENEVGILRQLLTFISEVSWLDDEKEWLVSNRLARNRLANLVSKVLSVAPEVRAGELRRAVARSRRLEYAPPIAILKRFCEIFKLAELNGELVRGINMQENAQLSGNEKILVEAFHTKGTILSREDLEEVCIDRYGLNPSSFYIYLSFSPLITRLARGVYCLVGSVVNPGQIEAIERERRGESKSPEYGWTSDGKLWCACPLARITIHSGGMRLPQFVSDLVDGEWSIFKSDSELIGSLKVKNNFIVGLRKPLYENGAEPGDLCLLIFDMERRRVALQLGGPDLVDRITENISSTELYADPLLD